MDPTLQHLDRHTRMWDFSEDKYRKDWKGWADMRAPWDKLLNVLGLPDVFNGEILEGTLFRLPLRNKPSDIPQASSATYSCRLFLKIMICLILFLFLQSSEGQPVF